MKTLLRVADLYLDMGIENTGEMAMPEAFALVKDHGKNMSRCVALCVNERWYRPLARLLLKKLTAAEINYLFTLVILYGGVEDFINTIRSIEETRITKPMNLSPNEQTS